MKKIIFILAFLVVLPLAAQKDEATLYFKDGTVVKGFAKIVPIGYIDKIKFRKKKGEKKIFYSSEELESIEIKKKKNRKIVTHIYCYKKTAEHGDTLLEQIEKGKASLYIPLGDYHWTAKMTREAATNTREATNNYIHQFYSNNKYYYVAKNGGISVPLESGKKFKKNASKYFSDCPELVEKIQSKEYKIRDMIKIVQFYNENCD